MSFTKHVSEQKLVADSPSTYWGNLQLYLIGNPDVSKLSSAQYIVPGYIALKITLKLLTQPSTNWMYVYGEMGCMS